MAAVPDLAGIIVVFPAGELDTRDQELQTLKERFVPGVPVLAVAGGERRQDSVRHGLAALPRDCDRILIHDSARPFFSASLVRSLLDALSDGVDGAIPALPVTDTVKQVNGDTVLATLRREDLRAVQTPQLFPTDLLRRVHDRALEENWEVTDDASMVELAGGTVRVVPGEADNIKITNPEDLRVLSSPAPLPVPCTGFGYDVHAYGGNRPMVLGGMPIAGAPMIKAHSDGDVLLHALCDAILGCLGLGDIGEHFPDSDDRFDNISSAILLSEVMDKARKAGLAHHPRRPDPHRPGRRAWGPTRPPSAPTWPGSWNSPTARSTSRPPRRNAWASPAVRKASRPWPWSRACGAGMTNFKTGGPWITRFAPSPTGTPHLGNIRTAVLNLLLARQSGGSFHLRLEDTDRERSAFAHEAAILHSLAWLGLTPDSPTRRQSLRLDLYRRAVDRLAENDRAYPCFCSEEELQRQRAESRGP